MATVVIIHAAEDSLPARALAEKLRQAKLDITMEHASSEALSDAVAGAAVSVALWSPRSVDQSALIEAAAAARGKLVHAAMQNAPLPQPFAGEPWVNLTGWRGEDDFVPWRDLAKLVTDRAGVAPLPPPAPRPPSGFFQPGSPGKAAAPSAPAAAAPARPQSARPAPQPRANVSPQHMANDPAAKSGGNGLMIGAAALAAVVVLGGGGYWFMSQTQQAAQTTALEELDTTSPSELRAFIENASSAEARDEARRALATLEQQSLDAAREANSIDAFEAFLRDFPDSEDAIFVQGQIQELRLQQANAPLTPETPIEATPATTTDPDLVPPGSAEPAPEPEPAPPAEGGPVPLTPAPSDPPAAPPTN